MDRKLGMAITVARIKKGMKQNELAERIGITPKTMCNYEKGKSILYPERIREIANVLGVSVGDLFDESEQMPSKASV